MIGIPDDYRGEAAKAFIVHECQSFHAGRVEAFWRASSASTRFRRLISSMVPRTSSQQTLAPRIAQPAARASQTATTRIGRSLGTSAAQ